MRWPWVFFASAACFLTYDAIDLVVGGTIGFFALISPLLRHSSLLSHAARLRWPVLASSLSRITRCGARRQCGCYPDAAGAAPACAGFGPLPRMFTTLLNAANQNGAPNTPASAVRTRPSSLRKRWDGVALFHVPVNSLKQRCRDPAEKSAAPVWSFDA